jgi:hypothetical protein
MCYPSVAFGSQEAEMRGSIILAACCLAFALCLLIGINYSHDHDAGLGVPGELTSIKSGGDAGSLIIPLRLAEKE